MFKEDVQRSSVAYGTLVRLGVFAFNLKGNYKSPSEGWEIQFTVIGNLDRDRVKEAARQYLIDAYRASGVYLFQKSSDNDRQFRAHFLRGDLR